MIEILVPERICYASIIKKWVLNVGAYHLVFDTKEEAEEYWTDHSKDFGVKGE